MIAQRVKYSLPTHEDPGLIPRPHVKKAGVVAYICSPRAGGRGGEGGGRGVCAGSLEGLGIPGQ